MTGVDLCCCNGRACGFWCGFAASRECTASTPPKRSSSAAAPAARRKASPTASSFTLADVCATGLPGGSADFVWGEDAWCYVVDKPGLIAEAARLVKPGGKIAFTDWVEGTAGDERRGSRNGS